MAAKDIVSEFVYFDGNSTDGTPQIIEYIAKKYKVNIKLTLDQDPKDLKDDYVRVFNDCLGQVTEDYAFFCHPDMLITKHNGVPPKGPKAYYTKMRSFAAEPRGKIYEFTEGRTDKWKNIMRNDFGLHYHGHYGVHNEDMYFKDITGDEHILHAELTQYPYKIEDSGIEVSHFSDVRSYERRLGRMITTIQNESHRFSYEDARAIAESHPRVSLQENQIYPQFKLRESYDIPGVFTKHAEEFAYVLGKKPEDLLQINLQGVFHE